MSFQASVQGWREFYVLAGGAAATLVGLLFVGLSIHLRTVIAYAEVRSLARVTLSNFALLLIVALFMVIPQDRANAASELIASGVFSVGLAVPTLASGIAASSRTLRFTQFLMRFALCVIGQAGVIVAGVLFANQAVDAGLTALVAVMVMLFVVSLRNTWDLLVTVADATMRKDTDA